MRARLVVATLLMIPSVSLMAQSKNTRGAARTESRGRETEVRGDDRQYGHADAEKCAARAGTRNARSSSKAQRASKRDEHDQRGQNEDADGGCTTTPPVGLAQVHGTVFVDANGDGHFTFPEAGVAGVTVQLTGTVSATAVTDATGAYAFAALPVGTYKVCVVPVSPARQTSPTTGPTCAAGSGWTLDVPTTMPDLWYGSIDFGITQ